MFKTGKDMYKKNVVHVESCYFAYKTFFFFLRSRCRPRRWILRSLMKLVEYREAKK